MSSGSRLTWRLLLQRFDHGEEGIGAGNLLKLLRLLPASHDRKRSWIWVEAVGRRLDRFHAGFVNLFAATCHVGQLIKSVTD